MARRHSHAGRLRERVTIQTPTQTTTSGGQPIVTWSTHKTKWANVESLTATEKLANNKPEKEVNWKITMRYDSSVTTQMRIQWRSKTLEFEPPQYDDHFRYMVIMAREVK